MSKLFRSTSGLLLATFALGCAVGPNHDPPEVPTPEVYRGEVKEKAESFADLPWWDVYRDPVLFDLIKEATNKSLDLRIALTRVEVARQSHRAAIWALAPTIGITGGVGDGVGTATIPGVYPPPNLNNNFGGFAGASWEPDVWGRLRRIAEVAEYQFEAAEEDRRGLYVTLVGDVAELYFTLAQLDQQQIYADAALRTRTDTLTLFQSRSQGGVGNDLEVARARASLEQARALLTGITLEKARTEHALSYLLARTPGEIAKRTPLDQIGLPPEIPAGLPSTLLERRPDIRSAEKRLRAFSAQIGVKQANFFPKFELTGYLGVASPDLNEAEMIRGGAALFNWTLPFLGGERIRAEYDAAIAQFEGSALDYERVALNAFREVSDSLFSVSTLRIRREALDAQEKSLAEAESQASARYRGGVANYLDVLTVQEQLLVAQLNLAEVKSQQMRAVARLYRTLGGGWPLPKEEDDEKKKDEKRGENPG